jgi:hypothetical protein
VRRSSIREMSHMWTPSNLTAGSSGGHLQATEAGYGLRVSTDCRLEHIVGQGGGLAGFSSYMTWLPDYGVGMFAMASLTYSGPSAPISQALAVMLKISGLARRDLPASPVLSRMREHILSLWKSWNDGEAHEIASMNLFRDVPAARRRAEIQKLKDEVGECTAAGPVIPQNWLRGQFNLTCASGTVGVLFTLSPTEPPAVQYLAFRKIDSASVRLAVPTGPPAAVACAE